MDNTATLLDNLLASGFSPERLDQMHDFNRLLGILIGQITLMEIAGDPGSDTAPRVAAARALIKVGESPEAIAERLKSTIFEGMTSADLRKVMTIMEEERSIDLRSVVERVKKERLESGGE